MIGRCQKLGLASTLVWLVGASGCASFTMRPNQPSQAATAKDTFRGSQISYARLCERQNQPQQAEQMYRTILKQEPQHPEALHRLAVVLAKQGKYDESHQAFQRALALAPNNVQVTNDFGYALYLQDRLPEAEQTLRQSLAKDPRNKIALNNLGLVLGQQGRTDESFALFRQAGNEADAHANIAYVHSMQQNFDAAKRDYGHALTLNPQLRPAAEAAIQVSQHQKHLNERLAQRGQAPRQIAQPPQNVPAPAMPASPISEATAVVTDGPTRSAESLQQAVQQSLAEHAPKRDALPSSRKKPVDPALAKQFVPRPGAKPVAEPAAPPQQQFDETAPSMPLAAFDQQESVDSASSEAKTASATSKVADDQEPATMPAAPLAQPIVAATPVAPADRQVESLEAGPRDAHDGPSDADFMAIASSNSQPVKTAAAVGPAGDDMKIPSSYPVAGTGPARVHSPAQDEVASDRPADTDMFGGLKSAVKEGQGKAEPKFPGVLAGGSDRTATSSQVRPAAAYVPAGRAGDSAVERAFSEVITNSQMPVTPRRK